MNYNLKEVPFSILLSYASMKETDEEFNSIASFFYSTLRMPQNPFFYKNVNSTFIKLYKKRTNWLETIRVI